MHYTPFNVIRFLLALVAVSILSTSCKKKDPPPEPPGQWLMTLNFTDDFINPKLKAVIFISDAMGAPVKDTIVAGNPRLEMYTAKPVVLPLQVTIARWEPDMHNFLVTISTYLVVSPSEWTFRGERLVSAGDATVNLQNLPAHTGPVLYASPGFSNLTFATAGRSVPVYQTPANLYIRLNTATGTKFKWKNDLEAGGTYDIDLSSMEQAEEHAVGLPFPAQDFDIKLFGYTDTSLINSLPILTDEQIGSGTTVTSINVGFPSATFQGFLTQISMIDSWTSPHTYLYSKFGRVPDAFVRIDASLDNISIQGSKAEFTGSGQYRVTQVRWNFQDAGKLAFNWTVYGPDTLTTVSLPALPPAMKNMFPTLSLDSLHLYQFELTQYPAISSWTGYLQKSFSPSDPGRIKRYESSSLRREQD